MNRNCLFALVILFVFVNGSDAAVLGQFRRLVGLKPPEDSKPEISPSPAPILPDTGSDLNTTTNVNSNNISTGKNNTQIPPIPSNSANGDSNDTTKKKKKKNEEGIDEKCESSSSTNRCTNDKDMIACLHLQHPQNQQTGLQEFSLLVQNEGESNLEVTIIVPTSVKMDLKQLQIPKHKAKKISGLVDVSGISTITLSAGSGECVLHTGAPKPPISKGDFFQSFQQIPSYTTLVRPIYGAYFLFVITLIVGGSWACCKFGKRGQQHGSGVPYQELEMGSSSAVNVETADGWDESWDDDWDEEKAVKSPGGQHSGNLSANGLISRPSSKDEWGNDWDD